MQLELFGDQPGKLEKRFKSFIKRRKRSQKSSDNMTWDDLYKIITSEQVIYDTLMSLQKLHNTDAEAECNIEANLENFITYYRDEKIENLVNNIVKHYYKDNKEMYKSYLEKYYSEEVSDLGIDDYLELIDAIGVYNEIYQELLDTVDRREIIKFVIKEDEWFELLCDNTYTEFLEWVKSPGDHYLYREIHIDKKDNHDDVGNFWTYNKSLAKSHWGDSADKDFTVRIKAKVPPSSINIKNTMIKSLWYYANEREVELNPSYIELVEFKITDDEIFEKEIERKQAIRKLFKNKIDLKDLDHNVGNIYKLPEPITVEVISTNDWIISNL